MDKQGHPEISSDIDAVVKFQKKIQKLKSDATENLMILRQYCQVANTRFGVSKRNKIEFNELKQHVVNHAIASTNIFKMGCLSDFDGILNNFDGILNNFNKEFNAQLSDIKFEDVPSSEDAGFTPWTHMNNQCLEMPNQAGVYEIRNFQSENIVFIGSCDDIHSQITQYIQHCITENTALDSFILENESDMQVRFRESPSADLAKDHCNLRLDLFSLTFERKPDFNNQ